MTNLPEDLEQQFQTELKDFEEARQMKYVTTIERWAEAKGEAKGKIEGKIEIARNMHKDNLPLEQISRLTGLTIGQLQELQTQV
jgi:predicted transposase/invertase (TIGR01784 family)